MKSLLLITSYAFLLLLFSNCASIVSKSTYPLIINSNPSEANITVSNSRSGREIYVGNTPATVLLKSGNGFFRKAQYQVTFSKTGYNKKIVPVYFKLDGWYVGNLVFGGFLGFLIVDPLTGAMFRIERDFLNETLIPIKGYSSSDTRELRILDYNKIPYEWKDHLVAIETD